VKSFKATSPDGVTLAAYETGNPAGPEILLIHGFNQAHLSWQRQLDDPALTDNFRIVAFDLRGHGASDKPLAPEHYTEDNCWANDVAGVIAAAGLKRPVLCGWSYGGRVITDYVRHHGFGRLAGINFVAANTKDDPAFAGPGLGHVARMLSDDLAENIAGTRAFVRACFERQPAQADFDVMMAFNMVVPAVVRKAVRARTPNPGDLLPTLRLPVLVTHGANDTVSLAARSHFAAGQIPGAKLSIFEGIGHAPFWEDTPRFDRELAELVRAANA
jgi:pimeloyl-ACP methyl ester carboxylesterase